MDNTPYFLALNRLHQIGPRTVLKLLERWPNLSDLFRLSPQSIHEAGFPLLARAISGFNFKLIESDLKFRDKSDDHYILTLESPQYPSLLREIHDPPPVLYACGDITALEDPTVAVVGTRNPSILGNETAFRFAYELSLESITVVSGLALGIDAQAHKGALEGSKKTIAVMGTGIDLIYPRSHNSLSKQIREKGLLVSEFPLNTPPAPGHFPRRNRIISGLSLATLVIEAAVKSGSLITARLAIEQNRDVLAVPGSIHNPKSRGCHYLLQQGAKLVTCTRDVLEEIFLDNRHSPFINTIPLANENQNLVKFIGYEVTSIDQIITRSGLDIETVICDLANLEIQGVIKTVSGGYMRCKV